MQLVADERTNSVLISGDRAVRVRIRGLIAHLDTPIVSGGNTRVVYLKYANAEDLVGILQGVSQGQAKVGTTSVSTGGTPTPAQPQQPTGANNAAAQAAQRAAATQRANEVRQRSAADSGQSNVDIQADAHTNSLIITAPLDEMQNILAVIRQLDIRRAQVLVEAVIAEITEDNTREFGINFLIDGSDKEAPLGYTNLGGGTDAAAGLAAAAQGGQVPSSLGSGISLALGRFGSGEIDFGFLVRAIASDADNNILSTPSLVTLDNEEAEIIVGSNVPFVTGQQLSNNNDNPFQTIERRDIGLTLKVKPQINEGNSIKMELEQEVSGVNTTAVTGAADITTSVRSIKTTVLVEDGQTLVLGGLIDDQITDVEEKVPFLGDIPVIGRLFRYRSTQKRKQNLMIFLHPVIMRDSETASTYSNSKYKQLRSKQTIYRQEKDNPAVRERPSLPDLKLFLDGEPVAQGQSRRAATVATTKPLPVLKPDELAPVPPAADTTTQAPATPDQDTQSNSIVTFSEQPALETTTN
jgi:general secretion pathway protein D